MAATHTPCSSEHGGPAAGRQLVRGGSVYTGLSLLFRNPLLTGLLIAVAEFATPSVNSVVARARVAIAPDHTRVTQRTSLTGSNEDLAGRRVSDVGRADKQRGT
jgi:hypothetical protein